MDLLAIPGSRRAGRVPAGAPGRQVDPAVALRAE